MINATILNYIIGCSFVFFKIMILLTGPLYMQKRTPSMGQDFQLNLRSSSRPKDLTFESDPQTSFQLCETLLCRIFVQEGVMTSPTPSDWRCSHSLSYLNPGVQISRNWYWHTELLSYKNIQEFPLQRLVI